MKLGSRSLLVTLVFLLAPLGCVGDTGPAGEDGVNGADGINGTDGTDGVACWDLNGNGVGDVATEDLNSDGVVDVSDCEGPTGQDGVDLTAVTAADKAAYDAADGMVGGKLYDYFVNELRDENAPNVVTDTDILSKPNFYRCKSCHGWDLLGRWGGLARQAITASYPEVAYNDLYEYAHLHNIKQVFNAVKNSTASAMYVPEMPDYGEILTDAQIWNLVKFLKKEAMNVDNFFDLYIAKPYPQPAADETATVYTDIGKNGDATAGDAYIASHCSACHGSDGTNINIYCKGDYLGNAFRDDAFEVQHKVKFGMPTDYDHESSSCTGHNSMKMPPVSGITEADIRDVLKAGQNESAYPSF